MKLVKLVGVLVISMLVATVAVVYIKERMQIKRCADRGEMMHLPTKYSSVSGCYVWTQEGWRPVGIQNIETPKP